MISEPQITISVGSSQRGRGNLKPDSGEYHHVGTNPRAGGGTSTSVSRARLVRGPFPVWAGNRRCRLGTPGERPLSRSAFFTHSSSVCGEQPIFPAIEEIAAQRDGCSPS